MKEKLLFFLILLCFIQIHTLKSLEFSKNNNYSIECRIDSQNNLTSMEYNYLQKCIWRYNLYCIKLLNDNNGNLVINFFKENCLDINSNIDDKLLNRLSINKFRLKKERINPSFNHIFLKKFPSYKMYTKNKVLRCLNILNKNADCEIMDVSSSYQNSLNKENKQLRNLNSCVAPTDHSYNNSCVELNTKNTLISEHFNNLTTSAWWGTQYLTGLLMANNGSLAGWSKTGDNAIHAVQRSGLSNLALVFHWTNTFYSTSGIANSNSIGQEYFVSFESSPNSWQENYNPANDQVRFKFEILDGSDAVIFKYCYFQGVFVASPVYTWRGFSYIGNGNGNAKIKMSNATPLMTRWTSIVDNLSLYYYTSNCPNKYHVTSNKICLDCTGSTNYFYNDTCVSLTNCPNSLHITSNNVCLNCVEPTPYFYNGRCNTFTKTTIFNENFNIITNMGALSSQAITGKQIYAFSDISGWTKTSGGNAIHGVIRDTNDHAAMIWAVDIITSDPITNSNVLNKKYFVKFETTAADFAGGQATSVDDRLKIEISYNDDYLLEQYSAYCGTLNATPVYTEHIFSYNGNGIGNIRVRIKSEFPDTNKFAGAIDNLTIYEEFCPSQYHITYSKVCKNCEIPNIYFYNNDCVSSCPNGFDANNVCNCPVGNSLYLGNCVSSCPLGFYVNSNNICTSCPDSLQASTANPPLIYLENNICKSACSVGYVAKISNSINYCENCSLVNKYYSTQNNITSCVTACPLKAFQNELIWQCVDSCTISQYEINNVCKNCSVSTPFVDLINNVETCVTSCPTNKIITDTKKCVSCPSTLSFIYENTCFASCPNGTGTGTGNNAYICSKCTDGKITFENKCSLIECDTTKYVKTVNSCTDCSKSTDGKTIFYNNQCVSSCPVGFIYSLLNNTCIIDTKISNVNNTTLTNTTLNTNSTLIENVVKDIECLSGFIVNEGKCVSCISIGKYLENGKCVDKCSSISNEINEEKKECLLCSSTQFYFNGNCIDKCSDGLYENSTSETSKSCSDCISIKKVIQNEKCVSQCLAGYGVDSNSHCKLCKDLPNSNLILDGRCVSSCPENFKIQVIDSKDTCVFRKSDPICDNNYCLNGGECSIEKDGKLNCKCTANYFGATCTLSQSDLEKEKENLTKNLSEISTNNIDISKVSESTINLISNIVKDIPQLVTPEITEMINKIANSLLDNILSGNGEVNLNIFKLADTSLSVNSKG